MEYYDKKHTYMDVVDSNYTNTLVENLILHSKINKNQKILEIGCGKGRFSAQLLKRGYRLTCIDDSESMLKEFRTLAEKNVKLICGDFNRVLGKSKNKFDAIIGFYILHHFESLEISLKNMAKLLNKGGTVAFIEPNPYNPMYYVQLLVYKDMSWKGERGILNMKPKKLSNIFAKSGFKAFKLIRFGFMPPFAMNWPIGAKADLVAGKIKFMGPIRPYQLVIAQRD